MQNIIISCSSVWHGVDCKIWRKRKYFSKTARRKVTQSTNTTPPLDKLMLQYTIKILYCSLVELFDRRFRLLDKAMMGICLNMYMWANVNNRMVSRSLIWTLDRNAYLHKTSHARKLKYYSFYHVICLSCYVFHSM